MFRESVISTERNLLKKRKHEKRGMTMTYFLLHISNAIFGWLLYNEIKKSIKLVKIYCFGESPTFEKWEKYISREESFPTSSKDARADRESMPSTIIPWRAHRDGLVTPNKYVENTLFVEIYIANKNIKKKKKKKKKTT
jgi:hypothetical protein